MKKLIFILLFIPTMAFAQWSHQKINGSFADHAGACMLITIIGTAATEWVFPNSAYSRAVGFALGMAAGLIKEFYETQPDEIDLIADFTGCCVGVALTFTIPYINKRRY